MRVGIVTFHYARNYGAFLQARELLNFIASLGHQVELVDYRNPQLEQVHRNAIYQSRRFWLIPARRIRWNRFERALASLPRSPAYRHADAIDWSRYDAVVYGSDEIWNFTSHAHGLDPVYFGEGPPPEVRKIAYAPSLGELSADVAAPKIISWHLDRFDAISARDDNTARFIKHCTGRSSPCVVDPVLIQGAKPVQLRPNGDLLVYGMLNDPERINRIRNWISVNERSSTSFFYRNGWCNHNRIADGPDEFMNALKQASHVLTTTFHGTLLAIVHGVPFTTIRMAGATNKFAPILDALQLQHRLVVAGRTPVPLDAEIDYTACHERLDEFATSSRLFLVQALA